MCGHQILSFVVLLSTIVIQSNAQKKLEFEKVASMINEAYAFASAGSDNGVYALTGGDDAFSYSNDLQFYDPKINQWVKVDLADLPIINFAAAAYIRNYHGLVFLGGTQPYGTSTALVEEVRMLSLDDFKITALGNIPEPANRMGIANDGKTVYFFGGSVRAEPNFLCTASLYSYDLSIGHLEKLPDMPKSRETKGAIVDGNLYVFGGYNMTPHSEVWKYNIEKKEWSELAPLERPLSDYSISQFGKYIITVGDQTYNRQLMVYDTKAEKATYFKMSVTGQLLGSAISGDYLYVYGGIVPPPNFYIKQETYRIKLSEILEKID